MNASARPTQPRQRRGSDPRASAWVSANAGSGKTYVLIDRVIRLMLAGTEPSRILCLTFTKAAAAEMNRRLFDRLGEWVAFDDHKLDEQLAKLGIDVITSDTRDRARKLFTLALETPGGLKIQTLHAFSERLLQLFPVEAGVIPGFEIMDERTAAEMLMAARHTVIAEAQVGQDVEIGEALQIVAGLVHAGKFDKLINDILAKRAQLSPMLADRRIVAGAIVALKDLFGLEPDADRSNLVGGLIAVDAALYRDLIALLETSPSLKTDEKSAVRLREILNRTEAAESLLRVLFLTGDFARRQPTTFMTNKLRTAAPEAARRFDEEQQRVLAQFGKISAFEMIEATESLLILAARIIAEYERSKRLRGAYDFDDLIHRTSALLHQRPSAAWVLYKLDGGVDHILVDEAQDTSPSQWQIVTALAEDFFSGQGARPDLARSVFVVGDRKQSIFSFQGADPDEFDRAFRYFAARIVEPAEFWQVPLTVSYRSTLDILSAVDRVFADDAAREGLNASLEDAFVHDTVRRGHAGLVELWPLAGKPEKEEPDPWTVPVDRIPPDHPSLKLAREIAQRIGSWINDKRVIESRGRAVKPGDILILVRSRNRFFDAILRELHALNIPVAGADRVKLGEHIAIQDLVALGHFALLPEDDHALACVLKSPLVRHPDGRNFDDEDLFAIAHGRGLKSLWDRLCETPSLAPIRDTLEQWMSLARATPPFEFFAAILTKGQPSCRQRILTRLGHEANDLIDAFLDLTLDYEHANASGLQGFLTWFAAAEVEIKRDMEQGSGEVRVMTVHGAKGLEANIVILPDTCAPPDGRTEANLLLAGNAVPLWRLSSSRRVEPEVLARLRQDEQRRVMEEYRRQLYVAMTRARDELYVCGYTLLDQPKSGCWYDLVKRGLSTHGRARVDDDGIIRLKGRQDVPAQDRIETEALTIEPNATPNWALRVTEAEPKAAILRAPSRLVRPRITAGAARRGRAMHTLFQVLPDLPATGRERAAKRLLARRGLAPLEAQEIATNVLNLIKNPDFVPFFSSNLAEVPFVARFGDSEAAIQGQIDRLVVTDDEVFVLDFKTDRQPPKTVAAVSPAYLVQLAAYRAGIAQVFPGKPVRAAILWTEAPSLMEFPAAMLDEAFSAYHNPVPRP